MAKTSAATADNPATVEKRWRCPVCGDEYPPAQALGHLAEEAATLQARLTHDVRTEADELGNAVVYGPGLDTHPAVWLRFRDIIVDSSVQRGRQSGHFLFKPGIDLDQNKTEAISVVPVYAPGPDGQPVLVGYRGVEGQHRVLKGQADDPDGYQLCKILDLETREQESATARQMSHSRSAFKMVDDWGSLLREGQENVVAAVAILAGRGYDVSNSYGPATISAAGALFKIIGVIPARDAAVTVIKPAAEGAQDLLDVIAVCEAIPADERDQGRRFAGVLLRTVGEIIDDNRDRVDIARLVKAASAKTAPEWLALAKDKAMGGRQYLRDNLTRIYNMNLKTAERKIY
jgi:hypothetical protein